MHISNNINEIAKYWVDKVLTGHLSLPNKLFIPETGLQLIELVKVSPQKSPENPGCCQECNLLSTDWQQGPFLKPTPTHLIENEDEEPVPTYSFLPYVLVSLVQEFTLLAIKRKI